MDKKIIQKIVTIAKKYPELELLILFGSRARGQAHENSDWDFGYCASQKFDSISLNTDLVYLLGTDKVDLVDLSRASGLLRFRAASDGVSIYQKTNYEYEKFWLQAVNFWCDAGPIIRKEYDALLKRL